MVESKNIFLSLTKGCSISEKSIFYRIPQWKVSIISNLSG